MKHFLPLLLIIQFICANAQEVVNIPDANFKQCLLENTEINTNGDAEIQLTEAQGFSGEIRCNGTDIIDATGLESFGNITSLDLLSNHLTQINLESNTNLLKLNLDSNPLTQLDITALINLEELSLISTQLEEIDLTQNDALMQFAIANYVFTSLDVTQNPALKDLSLGVPLTELDLSQNLQLNKLFLGGTLLNTLNTSQNVLLDTLIVQDNNTDINLTSNINLKYVEIHAGMDEIDLSQNVLLEHLDLSVNNLSTINLADNLNLKYLNVSSNQLTEVDFSPLILLEELQAGNNPFYEIDLSQNIGLKRVALIFHDNLTFVNMQNGHNSTMQWFGAVESPNLLCVQIDEGFDPYLTNWQWQLDPHAQFTTDCSEILSVAEEEGSNKIKIYPNPLKDILHIQSAYPVKEIRVFDMQGKLLKTVSNAVEISLSHLPKGMYLVQVKTEEGLFIEKVLKE